MSVKIGHASIDERGKASGGVAGDSTGKEVCTRKWYNGSWGYVLRPNSAEIAEKSAAACEAGCANDNIGYDQSGRNTLYARAAEVDFDLAKITAPCECDCSAFMHVCAIAGGANLKYGSNGCTTRNLVSKLTASGDYLSLTGKEYLESDKLLRRGDILVNEGKHTVMVLEDGAGSTSADEPAATPANPEVNHIRSGVRYSVELPLVQKGDSGLTVAVIQTLLNQWGFDCGTVDGEFGKKTHAAVSKYQMSCALEVDGKVGGQTWRALLGV